MLNSKRVSRYRDLRNKSKTASEDNDDGFSFLEQAVFVETLCLLLCTTTKGFVKGH